MSKISLIGLHKPLRANSIAMALPIPELAPVTTAVFPLSFLPPTHFGPRNQVLRRY